MLFPPIVLGSVVVYYRKSSKRLSFSQSSSVLFESLVNRKDTVGSMPSLPLLHARKSFTTIEWKTLLFSSSNSIDSSDAVRRCFSSGDDASPFKK